MQPTTDAATFWSDGELQTLRDVFWLLDTEQRGVVDVATLLEVLAAVSEHHPTSRSLQSHLLQESMPPTLTMEDFLRLLTSPHAQDTRDDDEKVFAAFDVGQKGYIDQDDLRAVATDLGEVGMTDEELQEMIQWASSNSGRVSLDQFREMLHTKIVR